MIDYNSVVEQGAVLAKIDDSVYAADPPPVTRFSDLDDIWMSAGSPLDIPKAVRQVTVLMRQRHHIQASELDNQPGTLDDFRVHNLTEISQALASTSGVMTSSSSSWH